MTVFLPYGPQSFFQRPLDGATVDLARTKSFRDFMRTNREQAKFRYPTIKGLGANKWGTVYAEGAAADPVWKMTGFTNPKANILREQGFRAPGYLAKILTGTSDSPFCVLDRANGWTVFGTKASAVGFTITVQSAGLTYHSSNGLDGKEPRSNDKRNTTSRGRLSDAMVIRADLVQAAMDSSGDLGHVLHLFMVETKSLDEHVAPMTGHESNKQGWGPEGIRVAIDPTVSLGTRGLTPAGMVIARTLQRHGCYLGDNAGGESCLKAQQNNPVQTPWVGIPLTPDSLAGITWDDFVVIKAGWPLT